MLLYQQASDHLQQAATERQFYRTVCEEVGRTLPEHLGLGQHDPCSYDGTVHYSMDFAQQVHYPYNPRQPGPVFLKTPRKCAVFGVACEVLPKQVTFLIDECVQTGKGGNCVISLLHYYLENYGLGESHMHLHADNCSGQNKNSYVMWYMMWRVLTGRHESIDMSFLLSGHTKFSCDWCFGLFKRNFRATKVDCLNDIVASVTDSSPAGIDVPQLNGIEDGTVIVQAYNWATFFAQFFTKVKDIKSYHHFHFDSESSGVTVSKYSDTENTFQHLLAVDAIDRNAMPQVIQPKGLEHKRQRYLFNEIREFVADEKQDIVCPDPGPAPVSSDAESSDTEEISPPPPKRGRGRGRGERRGRGQTNGRIHGRGRANNL